MSAPKSNGVCMYGVAKVLSTAKRILFVFATLDKALISTIFNMGFVGVSAHNNFVFLFIKEFIFEGVSIPTK